MPHQIKIGKISDSNPPLWLDTSTLGSSATLYEISTSQPAGENWLYVNQFCSLLSIYWLQNDPPSPFGLGNISDKKKLEMAEVLIGFAGLDDQANYAANSLSGKRELKENVVSGVENGIFATGTQIWAGNDVHVVAIRVKDNRTFQLYDSFSGEVETYGRQQFSTLMNALQCNAFVVAGSK